MVHAVEAPPKRVAVSKLPFLESVVSTTKIFVPGAIPGVFVMEGVSEDERVGDGVKEGVTVGLRVPVEETLALGDTLDVTDGEGVTESEVPEEGVPVPVLVFEGVLEGVGLAVLVGLLVPTESLAIIFIPPGNNLPGVRPF